MFPEWAWGRAFRTAERLMVKRQGMGQGGYFKGSVDDIMLRHYRVCDIYWEFGDAAYIMVLATAICSMQTTIPTSCAANRVMM